MATTMDAWDEDSDDEILAKVDLSEKGIAEALDRQQNAVGDGIVPIRSVLPLDVRPLDHLKSGYVWVSDLMAQNWCEYQMVYKMAVPAVEVENEAMTAGTSLHLARELEVEERIEVELTSKEDNFAVKVVNLLTAVRRFQRGASICREVPIFGAPFGKGVFISGIIDELRLVEDTMEIELVELKTRQSKSLPSKSQNISHKLQTMLYKRLFDDLVLGRLNKDDIAQYLQLDLKRKLGEAIMKHISLLTSRSTDTLETLIPKLFEAMRASTCVQTLLIEYCFQGTQETIGFQQVEYDEPWLESKFTDYAAFWNGHRRAKGVDIEDAWKCQKCECADICQWRDERANKS